MVTKRTQGPWEISDVAREGGRLNLWICGPNAQVVARGVENEKDASLIAAAPTMLEILTHVRTLMGEIDPDAGPVNEIKTALDAAIAEATEKRSS